ncbi:hypothetical protein NESM_000815800 [Novymonas esmeraldas]|uniref:Uncharacterized protein n=1 Tax=Novymonas esmeraldas TaxID=1808958 RepID=A0AAW0EYD7_9TRYP
MQTLYDVLMSASHSEDPSSIDVTGRPQTSGPRANVLAELTEHVARSFARPYGSRAAKESAESVLLSRRTELIKTVAAIRANEDTFGAAYIPAHVRLHSQARPAARDATRKPLYPISSKDRYRSIKELKMADGAAPTGGVSRKDVPAFGSLVATPVSVESHQVVAPADRDPRKAVADKYRAALQPIRSHVSTRVEQSILSFSRSLGAVKPYAMSRSTRLETRHCFADLPFDTNNRYVDRMQCCRPSKGLYTYY